jgi:hypothetical protein
LVGGLCLVPTGCEDVTVTVVEVVEVELVPDDVTILEGEEESVSAIPRTSDGREITGRPVDWSTDDPEVAVVSDAGVIRGEAPGTTTVRAETGGVQGTGSITVLRLPAIALSRSAVEFHVVLGRGDPPDEEVEIVNDGDGELSGLWASVETEGSEGGWLLAVLHGSVAPTTLTLAASAEGLSPDRYEGTVYVSSEVAGNSPREVRVALEVEEPPPEIHVDRDSVSFSAPALSPRPRADTVRIENTGGGILGDLAATIRYEDGRTGWLSAELDSSTAPARLQLVARAGSLWRGTYRAQVEVSSPTAPDGSRTVGVVFEVSLPWSGNESPPGTR